MTNDSSLFTSWAVPRPATAPRNRQLRTSSRSPTHTEGGRPCAAAKRNQNFARLPKAHDASAGRSTRKSWRQFTARRKGHTMAHVGPHDRHRRVLVSHGGSFLAPWTPRHTAKLPRSACHPRLRAGSADRDRPKHLTIEPSKVANAIHPMVLTHEGALPEGKVRLVCKAETRWRFRSVISFSPNRIRFWVRLVAIRLAAG